MKYTETTQFFKEMKVFCLLTCWFIIISLHSTDGQPQCGSARADFQANNTACLLAFERTATNVALGFSLDSADVDLVCNDVDCQAAIAAYVGSCSLNQSV